MKRFFTVIFLVLFSLSGYCKTRDLNGATLVARSFLQDLPPSLNKSQVVDQPLMLSHTSFDEVLQKPCFYVFNIGNDAGFVIVSADDRAYEVLGYSTQGSFDFDGIPDNFKNWLEFYQNELVYLSSLHDDAVAESVKSKNKSTSAVLPLLGSIKWDQGDPYNTLCPSLPVGGKAAVGCVATAMAQVMRYHQWPVQGSGSNSYITETHKFSLSVNFANTTYDWANMSPTYGSTSTVAEKSAVATLSYHCGVSVNMDYDEASGAHTRNSGTALAKYFGYDQDVNFLYRDYFGQDQWSQIIKNELDASRPVIYAGQSSDGGHAFVCDGYDADGFFHINWGWSGTSNGYYLLSALTPGVQGIGGGGSDGFNSSQGITVGIQKPDGLTNPIYHLVLDAVPYANVTRTSRTGKFTATVDGLYNMGINTFNRPMGIALYQNGQFVRVLTSKTYSIDPYSGFKTFSLSDLSIPTDVQNGDYKIFYVVQPTDGAPWQVLPGHVGTPNYLSLTVSSTEVIFNDTDIDFPKLSVADFAVTPTNLYQNKNASFQCAVSCEGFEYNSVLAYKFVLKSNTDITYTTSPDQFNIVAGETKDFFFTEEISLDPGEYELFLMYDAENNSEYPVVLSQVSGAIATLTVLEEPLEAPLLEMVGTASFIDNANVPKIGATFNATIKNSGGYFDDEMVVLIFDATGGNSIGYFGFKNVLIDKNEEQQLAFMGDINLPADDYIAALFYYSASDDKYNQLSSGVRFTLKDVGTSVSNANADQCKLYPNPATGFFVVSSPQIIQEIAIFDISGKLVSTVNANDFEKTIDVDSFAVGTYVVKIKTNHQVYTKKFVKK